MISKRPSKKTPGGTGFSLQELLDMETEFGLKVRDYRMVNGHYLAYKIPISSVRESGLHLPDEYIKRSIRNIVSIKAMILVSSAPYRQPLAKKTWVKNRETGEEKLKWKTSHGPIIDPIVNPGEFVFYNGYNIGKVVVRGLAEPLVIIRGIDIDLLCPKDSIDTVEVGHRAMSLSRKW